MLLRNQERRSRSNVLLAIFAIVSLIFVGAIAIISRATADDVYWTVPGIVRGIKIDATPDCSDGHSGWETATTYEKSCFHKKYNDLGALGSFNLIGLSEIRNNVNIYGNVVTKRLDTNQRLGISEWPEINYVSDYFNATTGFFVNSEDSIIVFGENIPIEKPSGFSEDCNAGNCYITIGNSTHQYGSWREAFWQDYEADFLDLDQLRTDAINYNQELKSKYINPDTVTYPNIANQESECTVAADWSFNTTCTVSDSDKISYVNLNANSKTTVQQQWGGTTDFYVFSNNGQSNSITINNVAPQGTFLLNIDAAGLTEISLNDIIINLTDGSCINGSCANNHPISEYAETAETNIVINIYDSSDSEGLFRGTVKGSDIYGMVIAPAATFSAQTVRGTVIANVIANVNNSYQSNFYGRLVVLPKVTVHHQNPDGTQFTYPGVDTSDQEFTIDTMEYTVSPVNLGSDAPYTITVSTEGYPASGQTPDDDFEVIFIYTKSTYRVTTHHVDENGDTLFEDTYEDYPYGETYTTSSVTNDADVNAGYYDIQVTSTHGATGTVTGDIEVTYTYTRKKATLIVNHNFTTGDTTLTHTDTTENINYGSSYSASPLSTYLDVYNVSPNESYSGTVSDSTVDDPDAAAKTITITYTYTIKQYTLTIRHIVDGTEVQSAHSETTVDHGTAISTNAYLDAYPAAAYVRSVSVSPTNATTVTQNTTVTYTYTIRKYDLTIKHIVDGVEQSSATTQENYDTDIVTNAYLDAYPEAAYIRSVSVDPEGATKLHQNTIVSYTYTIRQFNLTIKHVVNGVEQSSTTTQVNYGTEIITNAYLDAYPATAYNRSVSVTPANATTVTQNTTVTYTYTTRKFNLTIKHVVDGVEESSTTSEVDYGTEFSTSAFLNEYSVSHNHSVSVNPANATTVTQNTTVTYTYTRKLVDIIAKHIDGSGHSLADDVVTEDQPWGGTYITEPKSTLVANYDYVTNKNETGNIDVDTVDNPSSANPTLTVTYTYTRRTAALIVNHTFATGDTTLSRTITTPSINYGDNYEASPLADYLAAYNVTPSTTISGVVSNETVDNPEAEVKQITINFTYTIKRFNLTIKHVVDGVEESSTTSQVDYGTEVVTNAFLNTYSTSHNHSVTVNPTNATQVTANTTVTYTYTRKLVDIITRHVDGNGNSLADNDILENQPWDSTYVTAPKSSLVANYDYVTDKNETGNIDATTVDNPSATEPTLTVTYTYTRRTATLIVNHIFISGDTTLSRTITTPKNYGDTFEASPLSEYLTAYDVAPSSTISDVVSNETVDDPEAEVKQITVTFTYSLKRFNLTIKHIVNGVESSTTTEVDYGTEISTDAYLEVFPEAAYVRSVSVSPANATTVTQNTTVTYTYTTRKFNLTIKHIVDGVEQSSTTTQEDYDTDIVTDAYLDAYPAAAYARSVSVNPEGATKLQQNTTVTYTYTTRKFNLTIKHIVDGTEQSSTTSQVNYGTEISTNAYLEAYPEAAYVRSVSVSPANATTVTQDTTVTYTYTIRKFNLTIKHVVDGEEESNTTTEVNYGTEIATDAFLSAYSTSHNHSVSVDPANAVTVTQNTTVTYSYTRKLVNIIAKHVDGDGNTLKPNNTQQNQPWGGTYVTEPHQDLIAYYSYTTDKDETGNIDAATVDNPSATNPTLTVTYTYTRRTAEFQIIHQYANGEVYSSTEPVTKNYGDSFTASPDADLLVNYTSSPATTVSGTIDDTTVVDGSVVITFTYTKRTANIIAKHVDAHGNKLANPVNYGTVEYGGQYSTTPAASLTTAYNYTTDISANGTVSSDLVVNGEVLVIYTYTLKEYTLTVHHENADGTAFNNGSNDTVTNGIQHGTHYDSYPINNPNYTYTLKTGSDSASGDMDSNKVVTYVYTRKTASLRVIHKEVGGSNLIVEEPTTVLYGETYSANPAPSLLDSYDVSPTTTVSGTVSDETVDDPDADSKTITITFNYARKKAKIIAKHVDGNGNSLKPDVIQEDQLWDSTYTTVPHSELTTNYTYTTDKSETGVISNETTNADREVIVTYTYTRRTATFQVFHKDVNGDNLITTEPTTVYYGDTYSASPDANLLIAYTSNPDSTVSGTVSDETVDDSSAENKTITVTFTYTIKRFKLTVKHVVDGTENTSARTENYYDYDTSITLNSCLATYAASHDCASSVSPAGATRITENTTVTYTYTKKKFKLTVKHIVDGTELQSAHSETDVDYGTTIATNGCLADYTVSHNCEYSISPSGATEVTEPTTITYTYTKKKIKLTIKHIIDSVEDMDHHSETDVDYGTAITTTGCLDDYAVSHNCSYVVSPTGATEVTEPTTITYSYTKKKFTFTTKHQDMRGGTLAPTTTVEKEWGDPYTATPASSLVGVYNYTITGGSESGIVYDNVTIIYKYTKKAYVLTVHHIYENGDTYKPDFTDDYEHGDTYTANPDTSDINYEYRLKDGDSASGPITSNLEVTYIYKKKTATLTVIHIVDGSEISRDVSTVEWGESVSRIDFLSVYNESHDHSVSVNPDVTTVAGDVTVTYTYAIKKYTLTVHHRLESGSEYKPDVSTEYSHGATYTANPDTSDNNYEYRLATGDSASGPITSNHEVTYIYKKKTAKFTIKHVDSNGEKLAEPEQTTLEWGETYTAHPASTLTTAYDYVADKSESGLVAGDVTVTYTYTKKKFSVTVHHIKADGSSFAGDDTTTVEYGDSYTAVAKTDPNYNSVVTEGALVNENITSNTVITIKYILKQGHIVVKHIGENGETLAEESYDIDYGTTYSVSPKESLLEANDVTVDVAESDTVAGDVTITYKYSRKHYTITVHHHYENGDQYKPDDILPFRHGDHYIITSDTSNDSYDARLANRASTEGDITSNLEITFIYFKKKATFTIRHLDKEGNPLVADEETTLEYDEQYTAHPASSLVTAYDYTADKDETGIIHGNVTITYTYTKKKFIIKIHHVGKDGEALAEDEEVEVEFGDKYVPTGASSLIEDYDFDVDSETPIPEAIMDNLEITLIYYEKPEVPQTSDDIIAIISAILIAATCTGASLVFIKRRHA